MQEAVLNTISKQNTLTTFKDDELYNQNILELQSSILSTMSTLTKSGNLNITDDTSRVTRAMREIMVEFERFWVQ